LKTKPALVTGLSWIFLLPVQQHDLEIYSFSFIHYVKTAVVIYGTINVERQLQTKANLSKNETTL